MKTTRRPREEWRRHVRGWKASGLSASEYAAKAGLNPNTFSWWRCQLAKEPAATTGARGGHRRVRPILELVELTQAQTVEAIESGSPGMDRLELDVAGIVVRVPRNFEAESLTRLLQVLEARR